MTLAPGTMAHPATAARGREAPIFVVGVPRSGTTLLAAILAAHSRMSCGPETHFFQELSWLDTGMRAGLCRQRNWPHPAVEFLESIHHAGARVRESYGLSRSELVDFLSDRPAGVEAMLAALTEQYMRNSGKARWVEKTPDHMLYVREIRRAFPHSPIVRIVRDPRDVAVSLVRTPWGPDTYLAAAQTWLRYELHAEAFFGEDANSYTLRYEDLLRRPKTEARKLCTFLSESFEEGMLRTGESGRHVNRTNEPWKAKATQAIDPSRISAWQRDLSAHENRRIECLMSDCIRTHGYVLTETFPREGVCLPAAGLNATEEVVDRLCRQGIRLRFPRRAALGASEILIGSPDQWECFVGGRWRRAWGMLKLAGHILAARVRRRPLIWIPNRPQPAKESRCALVVSAVLRSCTQQIDEQRTASPIVLQQPTGTCR